MSKPPPGLPPDYEPGIRGLVTEDDFRKDIVRQGLRLILWRVYENARSHDRGEMDWHSIDDALWEGVEEIVEFLEAEGGK